MVLHVVMWFCKQPPLQLNRAAERRSLSTEVAVLCTETCHFRHETVILRSETVILRMKLPFYAQNLEFYAGNCYFTKRCPRQSTHLKNSLPEINYTVYNNSVSTTIFQHESVQKTLS